MHVKTYVKFVLVFLIHFDYTITVDIRGSPDTGRLKINYVSWGIYNV